MSDVLYEVTGHVARLTPNRPARGQGLTGSLLGEVEAAAERAAAAASAAAASAAAAIARRKLSRRRARER